MKSIFIFLLSIQSVHESLSAYCEKCEIIREANKKLPPPKHEYYEDYIKELKEEEEEKIEFIEDQKSKESK